LITVTSAFRFIHQRWFQIFIVGILLFFGAEQVLKFTGNPNFIPTVILLGAFVVPVTFVAYFYGQERKLDITAHIEAPLIMGSACFLIGGTIGVIAAGFLEYETLSKLSILGLFGVGAIEESAKLIFPIAIYVRGRYRSEADGLLFGVASGMGFAALETMGYGLVALISSQGDIGVLEEVLLIRGLLSPVGHAAWTGLVCAVLWHKREQTGRSFNPVVLGIFALAVVLHILWDIAGSFQSPIIAYAGYLIVGGTSLMLLIRKLREARRPIPSMARLG
jgi:RsiW-degrading membrane proteinase PrsW (M82 family)